MNNNSLDVISIGSGPAGYTAAIYGSRANLNVALFEGPQPGGQLTITSDIENFPGFPEAISGTELMSKMKEQATRFGANIISEVVTSFGCSRRPFVVGTDSGEYTAKAVIIATGASAKKLGAKGEDEYFGYGVSACATCDGFFFRNKDVVVIGGGDTAMEDAIYLANIAKSVTLIHRRDFFRASNIMVNRAKHHEKIKFMIPYVVEEFIGEIQNNYPSLTALRLRNTETGEIVEHNTDGAFVAIGHTPNTKLFEGVLNLYDGYLLTDGKSSRTTIEGVFACGDVQDSVYRQAITSAGTGCMAAIDAERWLAEQCG
jgi:thioredoxin reductase (NADPH)